MGIKLIGVHGKARAGKDTLASILVEECGFHRMAFADPLKMAAAVSFGWPVANVMHDDSFKDFYSPVWEMTVREALQRMGTEAMRKEFGDDFWIKRWYLEYHAIAETTSVVVSDVRSEREAEAIRSLGGLIIHLRRDGAGLSGSQAAHSSESGIRMNRRDIEIVNNGTIDDLKDVALRAVAFIERNAQEFGLRNITVE